MQLHYNSITPSIHDCTHPQILKFPVQKLPSSAHLFRLTKSSTAALNSEATRSASFGLPTHQSPASATSALLSSPLPTYTHTHTDTHPHTHTHTHTHTAEPINSHPRRRSPRKRGHSTLPAALEAATD